jgi:hypothetical protein
MRSCEKSYRFKACEPGVERVVRAACHDRDTISVVTDRSGHGVSAITVLCCAGSAHEEQQEEDKRPQSVPAVPPSRPQPKRVPIRKRGAPSPEKRNPPPSHNH